MDVKFIFTDEEKEYISNLSKEELFNAIEEREESIIDVFKCSSLSVHFLAKSMIEDKSNMQDFADTYYKAKKSAKNNDELYKTIHNSIWM